MNPKIIIKAKFVELRQKLIQGEIELFNQLVDQLSNSEIVEFSYYALKAFKGEDFSTSYYGVRVMGEFASRIIVFGKYIGKDDPFEKGAFFDQIYMVLGSAFQVAIDHGFYADAENYGKLLLKNPNIEPPRLKYCLECLATCAHYRSDFQQELKYCEQLLATDPNLPFNHLAISFAKIHTKDFDSAQKHLEKCIESDFHEFKVYNQLALVRILRDQDFFSALKELKRTLSISGSGMELTLRNRFVLSHNMLSFSALTGDKGEFRKSKETVKEILSNYEVEGADTISGYAMLFGLMNEGIYQLNNGFWEAAMTEFEKIIDFNLIGPIPNVAELLNGICKLARASRGIKSAESAREVFSYANSLPSPDLLTHYREVIIIYYQVVVNAFELIDLDQSINFDLERIRQSLRNQPSKSLSTSVFIGRAYQIMGMIESFQRDYTRAILKAKVINDYRLRLEKLLSEEVNLSKEPIVIYSATMAESSESNISQTIARIILLLQRTEPSFIKNFKSKKTSQLLETDFRDFFQVGFGMVIKFGVSSESKQRSGRTDLQIESPHFGRRTFEFKIWGSNDYKDVTEQVYNYLSDDEPQGYIIMINKNRNSIEKPYLSNLGRAGLGLVEGSIEKREIMGVQYFISSHKIAVKTKKIYHFILNIF